MAVTSFLVSTAYPTDVEIKEKTKSSSALAVMCIFLFLFILFLFICNSSVDEVRLHLWMRSETVYTAFINLSVHHQDFTFLDVSMIHNLENFDIVLSIVQTPIPSISLICSLLK